MITGPKKHDIYTDKDTVRYIKSNTDIIKIIGSRIKLNRIGNSVKALCPFHQEKTPSFIIDSKGEHYHCFGCGAHGDVIDFVSSYDGVTFKEALNVIAHEGGLSINIVDDPNKELYEYTMIISRWFTEQIKSTLLGNIATEYLKNRGISEESINKFNIGYCPDYISDNILNKIPINILYDLGIARHGTKLAVFSRRLIFPIFDRAGRIVAFGGRIIEKDSMVPKYINSKENKIFKKSECFYGINLINKTGNDDIFIVEGYLDVIMFYQYGIKNVISPMGTAFKSERIPYLWDLGIKNVVICFDGDKAGNIATNRLAIDVLGLLKSPDYTVNFVLMPNDVDPADMIKSGLVLPEKKEVCEVIFDSLSKNVDFNKPGVSAKFENYLDNLICKIPNQIIKKHYRSFFKEKIYQKYRNFKIKNNKIDVVIDYLNKIKSELSDKICQLEIAQVIIEPSILNNPGAEEDFMRITANDRQLNCIKSSIISSFHRSEGLLDSTFVSELSSDFTSMGFITSYLIPLLSQQIARCDVVNTKYSSVLSGLLSIWREVIMYEKKIKNAVTLLRANPGTTVSLSDCLVKLCEIEIFSKKISELDEKRRSLSSYYII